MQRYPIYAILFGAFACLCGCLLLWHLLKPLPWPPRWGKSGRNGPLMSRRSILIVGAAWMLFGLSSTAVGLGFLQTDRPAVFTLFLTVLSMFTCGFADWYDRSKG